MTSRCLVLGIRSGVAPSKSKKAGGLGQLSLGQSWLGFEHFELGGWVAASLRPLRWTGSVGRTDCNSEGEVGS